MYHSLDDSDPLKQYLKNNCDSLLNLDCIQKNLNLLDNYEVESKNNKGHPSLYKGQSGCYIFYCKKTNSLYIGSAVCFYTRFKGHKVNSYRPNRGGYNALYRSVGDLGWNNFIWKPGGSPPRRGGPILITNNHIHKFTSLNPGLETNLNVLFILRAFTQFEARIFEQGLITQFSPNLNGSSVVTFPFTGWKKGNIIKSDSSKSILVKGGDNTILNFASRNRAAIALGISKTTFDRYINLTGYPVYSPILDMDVLIEDPFMPLSQNSPGGSPGLLIFTKQIHYYLFLVLIFIH